MIGFAEAIERRTVDAKQRRLPVRGVEPVEIDQEAHDAIAEAMADRLEPCMHDVAEVQHGCGVGGIATGFRFMRARGGGLIRHGYSAACASSGGGSRHGTVAASASATANPDRNPSS